jgi:hypothetical protein
MIYCRGRGRGRVRVFSKKVLRGRVLNIGLDLKGKGRQERI